MTSMDFKLEELEEIVTKEKGTKKNLLDKAFSLLGLAHSQYIEKTALELVLDNPVTEDDPESLKEAFKDLTVSDYSELTEDEKFNTSYPEVAAHLKEAMQEKDWNSPGKLKDLLAKVYSTGVYDGIDEQLRNESLALQKKKPEMNTLLFRLGHDEPPYMKVEIAKDKISFEKAIADLLYSGIYGEYETPDCSDALAYLHKVGKEFMPQIEEDMILRECAD